MQIPDPVQWILQLSLLPFHGNLDFHCKNEKQRGEFTPNVILWRLNVAIVAMEKQQYVSFLLLVAQM
jgi:hypothetical protein